MPGQCGRPAWSANREVVAFGLDPHREVERCTQRYIGIGRAQSRAQIDLLGPAEARVQLPGCGHPHPVAAFAEVVGERGDEPDPPACFSDLDIVRRAAGAVATIDDFAAKHGGNAPVFVFADSGGAFNNDTGCVNGVRGNAADQERGRTGGLWRRRVRGG